MSSNASVLEEIKSRGYWRIVIRPDDYVERRVEGTPKLLPILRSCALHIRGWDFPHINENPSPINLSDSIETSISWEHYVEYWRFYLSGQFAGLKAIPIDWRDRSPGWWGPITSDPKVEKLLPIGDTIARITEIFEFTGRLAKSPVGAPTMLIDLSCHGLENRALAVMPYDNRMPLFQKHTCHIDNFKEVISVKKDDLASSARELAIPMAQRLFNLFAWDPTAEHIREWQQQVMKL
jgi:hypothetical protein